MPALLQKKKIFLLSEKEVTTSGYGFADYNVYINDGNGTTQSSRVRKPSDFVIANYAWQGTSNTNFGVRWMLRSPFFNDDGATCEILSSGEADGWMPVTEHFDSIVPALSISAK